MDMTKKLKSEKNQIKQLKKKRDSLKASHLSVEKKIHPFDEALSPGLLQPPGTKELKLGPRQRSTSERNERPKPVTGTVLEDVQEEQSSERSDSIIKKQASTIRKD